LAGTLQQLRPITVGLGKIRVRNIKNDNNTKKDYIQREIV